MTPEVWIALFGLIGTLGAGLGANVLNNRAAREREQLQWEREIGEKRRLERLEAYEDFSTLATTALVKREPLDSEALIRGIHRMETRFSPSIGEVAGDFFEAAMDLMVERQKPEEEQNQQEQVRLVRELSRVKDKLLKLIREDLVSSSFPAKTSPEN